MGISTALSDDAPIISEIIAREFPYTQATPGNLRLRMSKPQFKLFKAVEKGEIAGFVELELLDEFLKIWRINGIAVKKEFRQNGIGNSLAEFAVSFAKRQNASQVVLLVRPENYIAKKMYKKLGFESNGLWKSQINGKKAEEWILQLKNYIV